MRRGWGLAVPPDACNFWRPLLFGIMTYQEADRWLRSKGGSRETGPEGDGQFAVTVSVPDGTDKPPSRMVMFDGKDPNDERNAFVGACEELREYLGG